MCDGFDILVAHIVVISTLVFEIGKKKVLRALYLPAEIMCSQLCTLIDKSVVLFRHRKFDFNLLYKLTVALLQRIQSNATYAPNIYCNKDCANVIDILQIAIKNTLNRLVLKLLLSDN